MDFLKDLAKRLYDRRHHAVMVPYEDRSSGQFQPVHNDCHRNVELWCQANPSHRPVRGWLVFSGLSPPEFCRFTAHSVIEDDTGRRFDVTPSATFARYPFLEDEAIEEEYVLLISSRGLIFLDHQL